MGYTDTDYKTGYSGGYIYDQSDFDEMDDALGFVEDFVPEGVIEEISRSYSSSEVVVKMRHIATGKEKFLDLSDITDIYSKFEEVDIPLEEKLEWLEGVFK